MRSNLELFILELSSFGFNSEFKDLQICLTPNMCKFKIVSLKVMETIPNYKFETKHIDYL